MLKPAAVRQKFMHPEHSKRSEEIENGIKGAKTLQAIPPCANNQA